MIEENYLRSIDDPKGILDCYETYGAVGITGVLSAQECAETVDDVKLIIKQFGANEQFNIYDPNTFDNWPDMNKFINKPGVIGTLPIITKTLNRNRFHPNVKKAYSLIYGLPDDQLLAQFDRIGWMRPVLDKDGNKFPQYATPLKEPGKHLDVNPSYYFDDSKADEVYSWLNKLTFDSLRHLISENNATNIKFGRHCIGVLNLIDNKYENGGFRFTPGGHKITPSWYIRNQKRLDYGSANGNYFFDEKDEEFLHSSRIPCPAGTLIIFDAALPHGTLPNQTSDIRMVQFLRYMPKKLYNEKTLARRKKLILNYCSKNGIELDFMTP